MGYWAAIASVAGSYLSSSSQSASAEASAEERRAGQQQYAKSLNKLLAGAGEDVFGSSIEAAPYIWQDPTKSQQKTIEGNLQNLPTILNLDRGINAGILENDLLRIQALYPGYNDAVQSFSTNVGQMLKGQAPFTEDVYGIISNRAELANSLGIPGALGTATAKDLGLARQDIFNSGASLFQNWLQTANAAVSPIASQARPQQMMFTPQERLAADIQQAQLDQQSRQNAFILDAMPDPVASGRFQAQLAALPFITGTGQQSAAVPGWQGAAGAALTTGAQAYAAYAGRNQNQGYGYGGSGGYYQQPNYYQDTGSGNFSLYGQSYPSTNYNYQQAPSTTSATTASYGDNGNSYANYGGYGTQYYG